jgi:hypothetical protein
VHATRRTCASLLVARGCPEFRGTSVAAR